MSAAEGTTYRVGRTMWKLTALRVALWVLIAAGPLVAGGVWARLDALSQQLTSVAQQATATSAPIPSEVEGVAELVVADMLARGGVDEPTALVVRTVSLGAEELDPGYYTVTIAALADDGPTVASFYLVGVASTPSGWAVAAPPALISGLRVGDAPEVKAGMRSLDSTPGLTAAVDGFLAAFLVGDGDVARYTAPQSPLVAVTPPPFTVVDVIEAASTSTESGVQLVVAAVDGTRPDGHVEVLEYWLEVAERDGRWEVTDLLAGPPLELANGRGDR